MNNQDFSTFSREIKTIARNLAVSQKRIAKSPGQYIDNKPILCAAACLAYAEIYSLSGISEADAFARELCKLKSKISLNETLKKFGVPEKVTKAIRMQNDLKAPESRFDWFLVGTS